MDFLGKSQLSGKLKIGKTIGVSLVSTTIFFAISNLGVWLFGNLYSMDVQGFIQCYIMAIPFNKFSWLGDLCYVAILFGIYEFVSIKYFTNTKELSLQKSEK